MTKFSLSDHNDALRACWDARAFGAIVADNDIVILNRVAGAYAANEPETLTAGEFAGALTRVRIAIAAAREADPDRAARIEAERIAKRDAMRAPGSKAKKAAARAARYENDPVFRARCDSFGTKPKGLQP